MLPDLSLFQYITKTLGVSIEELLEVDNKKTFDGVFESQNLINKIKSIRKEEGITQTEFGKKIGVSADTVSKWEQGKSLPDIERILTIAKVFNLSPSEIYYGINSKEDFEDIKVIKGKKKLAIALTSIALAVVVVIAFCCYFIIGSKPFYYPIKSKVIITEHNSFYHNEYINCYEDHVGIDIYAKEGQEVFSAIDGKISLIISGTGNEQGFQIENENGYKAIYYYVEIYDTISFETEVHAGQRIGRVISPNENTAEVEMGVHLHFEFYFNNQIIDIKELI